MSLNSSDWPSARLWHFLGYVKCPWHGWVWSGRKPRCAICGTEAI